MEEAMSDEIEIVISQENYDEILDYLTMTRKCLLTKIKTSFPWQSHNKEVIKWGYNKVS